MDKLINFNFDEIMHFVRYILSIPQSLSFWLIFTILMCFNFFLKSKSAVAKNVIAKSQLILMLFFIYAISLFTYRLHYTYAFIDPITAWSASPFYYYDLIFLTVFVLLLYLIFASRYLALYLKKTRFVTTIFSLFILVSLGLTAVSLNSNHSIFLVNNGRVEKIDYIRPSENTYIGWYYEDMDDAFLNMAKDTVSEHIHRRDKFVQKTFAPLINEELKIVTIQLFIDSDKIAEMEGDGQSFVSNIKIHYRLFDSAGDIHKFMIDQSDRYTDKSLINRIAITRNDRGEYASAILDSAIYIVKKNGDEYQFNYSWLAKKYPIFNKINRMRKFFEAIIQNQFIQRRTISEKNDIFTRWLQEGLTGYYVEKYFAEDNIDKNLLNASPPHDGRIIDILKWSLNSDGINAKNLIVTDSIGDPEYYNHSIQFFIALEEGYGYQIIEDLLDFMHSAKKLLSEDILLFFENRIGKEGLSELIGEKYIERVKEYRMSHFRKVFEESKNNPKLLKSISSNNYISAPDELKREIQEYLSGL